MNANENLFSVRAVSSQEANERQRLGDWEGDTIVGKGRKGYLLTCVDRASRYLIARKVKTCAAEPI